MVRRSEVANTSRKLETKLFKMMCSYFIFFLSSLVYKLPGFSSIDCLLRTVALIIIQNIANAYDTCISDESSWNEFSKFMFPI